MTKTLTDKMIADRALRFTFKLPRHATYIETRGSTGAWLFRKPRSPLEVLNDADGAAANLSRVLIEEETRIRVMDRYASCSKSSRIVPFLGPDDRVARAAQFVLEIERALVGIPPSSYRLAHRYPLGLMPRAMWNSAGSTIGENAPLRRTHIAGAFLTRFFFSLNEMRL